MPTSMLIRRAQQTLAGSALAILALTLHGTAWSQVPAMSTAATTAAAKLEAKATKSAANGLVISGDFFYDQAGASVILDADRLSNNSPSRTTGTLRLELWATPYRPARGANFAGYRLATSAVFQPLAPLFYYFDVTRTAAFTPPPDGTYWMVLVLAEYDAVGCPNADGFCMTDTGIFDEPDTFGDAPPPSTQTAVEYFHAAFGHFFITAAPAEIAALDAGSFVGWARTGQSFSVYAMGTTGAANVCRFFTTSFSPKSSHFYTPFASECTAVKTNRDWQFEAEVFALKLPTLGGLCPAGTSPLYRLYNNGLSGAPNHRYTTSLSIRSAMLDAGAVAEGFGSLGVIGCVPG